MAMGEDGAVVINPNEVVPNDGSSQNSPWKKPVSMPAESPVMGEKVWPSLADVQTAKATESLNTESKGTQNPDGRKKSNDGVNGNSLKKHFQPRYFRGRPKKSQNAGPPFPVPVVARLPYPALGPFLPPVRGYGNFYQPMPAPFPNNSFSSLHPDMDDDSRRNFHSPERRGQAVNPPRHFAHRPHNTVEVGGYYCYPRPLPVGPKGIINMQANMAPRTYMRPPLFIGGPPFPGPGQIHYRPVPHPFLMRPPSPHWIAPNFVNPCAPPPEGRGLKEAIVKQIEYYFSDENLLTDRYLLAQMDDQGWVPISVIAEFRRVKWMCTDIQFILDALRSSASVEVQGNKLRKYDSSSKNSERIPANDVENNLSSKDSTSSNGSGESGTQ